MLLNGLGYEALFASNGKDALRLLLSPDAPSLAILEANLSEMSGIDVCYELARKGKEPKPYVYLLVKAGDPNEVQAALHAGADHISKPVYPADLEARLRVGRRFLQLQQELDVAHQAINFQATHDLMTGFLNRAAIMNQLQGEMARALRAKAPTGVILAGPDQIKTIHEMYGDKATDSAIRAIARKILPCIRPYDAIGRSGASEFLVVAPGCDFIGLEGMAERMRALLGSGPIDVIGELRYGAPDEAKERKVPVTLSLGIFAATGVRTPYELIHPASVAYNQARKKGGNRLVRGLPPSTESAAPGG